MGDIENAADAVDAVAVVDDVEDIAADLYYLGVASGMDFAAVPAVEDVSAETAVLSAVVDIAMAMMDHSEEKAHLYPPLRYPCCPSFAVVGNFAMVAAAPAAEIVVDIAAVADVMDAVTEIASYHRYCEIDPAAVMFAAAALTSHHRHLQHNPRVLPYMVIL